MSQPLTALGHHARFDALTPDQTATLRAGLEGLGASLPDGARPALALASPLAGEGAEGSVELPPAAAEAVLELLSRLANGDGVELSSAQTWLNTSQAARLAGISATYLRNLTDAGEIPVSYRGSHRRFLSADITGWVQAREAARAAADAESTGSPEASEPGGTASPAPGVGER
jgi:excisionase family DNA binding protein